jgi:3-oxoacyl-[acyl-carrier protein] reductase
MERKSGNIINIGSTAAVRGAPKGTAYYGSKFALRGMTECWRAELRPYNVRVMLVNPSEVLTDFYATAGLPQNKENPTKLRGEDIAHAIKAARQLADGATLGEVKGLLGAELLVGAVYGVLGYGVMRWFEYQSRRSATLERS